VLAAVFTAVLMMTNMTYGVLAARARIFFKSRRAIRNLNRTAGTMMIGARVAVAAR
jgi:threonine/homoserine/homoserine lactone efflux protein